MSTNKANTKAEALKLKHAVDAIAVIGMHINYFETYK
jgi:hypothetical protein